MKKWFLFGLMLVMATVLLAGCGQQDPEKTAALVVADIDGEQITRGEAYTVYNFMLNQMVLYNAQYGYTVDPNASDVIASVKGTTINMMVEGVALKHKLDRLGGAFTEEELAGFATDAQAEYTSTVESYMENYGVSQEEARTAVNKLGFTPTALEYMILREETDNRLYPYAVEGVDVTDEEVRARYDELVQEATQRYTDTPSQYVSDVLNNSTIYARPEGFRYVQNLVVQFPEEIRAQISELDNEYYDVYMQEYNDSMALSGTGLTDDERAEIDARMATYQEKYEKIEADIAELRTKGHAEMLPEAEEILAMAQAPGADFVALMEEYSGDTASGDLLEVGYPVAEGITSYVPTFTDGAMALANIGDVSGLVESDYGMHIIRYASDVPAGSIAFEEVQQAVHDELLETRKQEVYNAKLTEWVDEAKIKTYLDRF